ncbi:LacI family DNA-binding transcriptional regulator [Micromonospora sp. NPDC050397]|uniref:LacI family DNA-binding transcriptional regulator n=1 Tax=Micromonospora sp. NPDC050397 TaxID=3364279 RepID=UPI00384C0AD4
MVADQAGVSRQTVSNVLNAPHLVRAETRRRVRGAIRLLGYRPNQAARTLRIGRSRLLAARIDASRHGDDHFDSHTFLRGLTEAAARSRFHLILYDAVDAEAEIRAYEDLQVSYQPAGFVLLNIGARDRRTTWLADHNMPFVVFGGLVQDQYDQVSIDDTFGTAEMTRRLLTAGHRRIGFIDWPRDVQPDSPRRAGWMKSMADAGADLAGLERRVSNDRDHGERAAADLLGTAHPPTALVCGSDLLALGAMWASSSTAPSTAVTGYGDTPVAAAVGLTSVDRRVGHAAASCIDMVTEPADGDRPGARRVLLQPRIVARRSG